MQQRAWSRDEEHGTDDAGREGMTRDMERVYMLQGAMIPRGCGGCRMYGDKEVRERREEAKTRTRKLKTELWTSPCAGMGASNTLSE